MPKTIYHIKEGGGPKDSYCEEPLLLDKTTAYHKRQCVIFFVIFCHIVIYDKYDNVFY